MSTRSDASRKPSPVAFIVVGLFAVVLGFGIAKKAGVADYGLAKRGVARRPRSPAV